MRSRLIENRPKSLLAALTGGAILLAALAAAAQPQLPGAGFGRGGRGGLGFLPAGGWRRFAPGLADAPGRCRPAADGGRTSASSARRMWTGRPRSVARDIRSITRS